MTPPAKLLQVDGLRVTFRELVAVDGLSFELERRRTLGLVGESGCGKSVTALSILGLLPEPGQVAAGRVLFEGRNLLELPEHGRRALRGKAIGLVSQDPLAALNPVHTVGAQVAEGVRHHERLSRAAAWSRAVEALGEVGLPAPVNRARDYPHHLSGGQRQRVVIAMAIVCRPRLLIADEPTTALDVSVQAQILALLRRLRDDHDMGLMLISHDLGVVAEMADEVTVMRAGKAVEQASAQQLYAAPQAAYTRALLAAVPRLDVDLERLPTVEDAIEPR